MQAQTTYSILKVTKLIRLWNLSETFMFFNEQCQKSKFYDNLCIYIYISVLNFCNSKLSITGDFLFCILPSQRTKYVRDNNKLPKKSPSVSTRWSANEIANHRRSWPEKQRSTLCAWSRSIVPQVSHDRATLLCWFLIFMLYHFLVHLFPCSTRQVDIYNENCCISHLKLYPLLSHMQTVLDNHLIVECEISVYNNNSI